MAPCADTPTVRRLAPPDADAAAEVLASAFCGDPLWRFLLPDPARRAALVRQAFRAFMPGAIAAATVLGVGMPLEGVAIWSPPDQPPLDPAALLNANLLTLLFSPLALALPRAAPIVSRFETLRRRYAPEPHYYLSAVGVLPSARGRGRASALLQPILAQADARGLTAYLETLTPANVPLYQHYGFVVREELAVPDSDLRIWALYRPRLADAPQDEPRPSRRQVK